MVKFKQKKVFQFNVGRLGQQIVHKQRTQPLNLVFIFWIYHFVYALILTDMVESCKWSRIINSYSTHKKNL